MTHTKRIAVFADKSEVEQLLPKSAVKEYGNARFWDGKYQENCDAVYAPDFPKIESVYRDSGRTVYRQKVENEAVLTFEKVPSEEIAEVVTNLESLTVPASVEESSKESQHLEDPFEEGLDQPTKTFPDFDEKPAQSNWRELSWPKMRSLATNYTEEPIKSKQVAQQVLEDAEASGKLQSS